MKVLPNVSNLQGYLNLPRIQKLSKFLLQFEKLTSAKLADSALSFRISLVDI